MVLYLKKMSSALLVFVIAPLMVQVVVGADTICTSSTNTFTVKVDLHAGELGYYYFEECGKDNINPVLGIEMGETYTFLQVDRSNYMHPLGFAYYVDGAHEDNDELEPGIVPPGITDSSCADTFTCPAPMYYMNDGYLGGSYDFNSGAGDGAPTAPETPSTEGNGTTGVVTPAQVEGGDENGDPENFGLDDYEPLFFHPAGDWTGYGNFSVKVQFEGEGFQQDIFYFCHIHHGMTGRIKILQSGVPVNEADEPALPEDYYKPVTSDWDKQCGTYNLVPSAEYAIPCPKSFVCGMGDLMDDGSELTSFAQCLDSMNCAMFQGMTTHSGLGDLKALFMLQMIPHHQNAVNMAKTLLVHADNNNNGILNCDSLDAETDDCEVERILREMINNQNAQIQAMQAYLDSVGLGDYEQDVDKRAECFMEVWPQLQEQEDAMDNDGGSSGSGSGVNSDDPSSTGTEGASGNDIKSAESTTTSSAAASSSTLSFGVGIGAAVVAQLMAYLR